MNNKNKSTKRLHSHQWGTVEILQARCPYCRKNIETDEKGVYVGGYIKCPLCKNIFILGKME